ncbi:MAG: GNAT family N-acetyltransferase [Bacteroidetes bacterium]|nr:GNAT family N-acetyltransferase [Bacteroidota bacterium]
MENPYSSLDWDSRFFGFPVGKILPGRMQAADLGQALEQARSEGYRLLYWAAKPEPENAAAAASAGGELMDRKRVYVHDLEGIHATDLIVNWFIESYRKPMPDADMEALALAAGEHSRFRRDPRFGPEAFKRLYLTWIRNSVNRSFAEEVLFIEDFGIKRALLTIGLHMGRPDIGLVATDAAYRGRGMAGDLVRASLVWAINRDYREAQVTTQAENTGACAFYEAMGYKMEREDWIYHFWC